jgi:hypothetical protein
VGRISTCWACSARRVVSRLVPSDIARLTGLLRIRSGGGYAEWIISREFLTTQSPKSLAGARFLRCSRGWATYNCSRRGRYGNRHSTAQRAKSACERNLFGPTREKPEARSFNSEVGLRSSLFLLLTSSDGLLTRPLERRTVRGIAEDAGLDWEQFRTEIS